MPFHISPKLRKHFKGFCSLPEIIMLFVYMKCIFSLSYRDLEEMANKFVPLIDKVARKRKKLVIAGE